VSQCDVPAKYGVDALSLDDIFLDAKYVVAVSPIDRSRSVKSTLAEASRKIGPAEESVEAVKPAEESAEIERHGEPVRVEEREESTEERKAPEEAKTVSKKPKRASKATKDAILEYAKQHPTAKPRQIAEAVGCHVDYVRQVLRNVKKKKDNK